MCPHRHVRQFLGFTYFKDKFITDNALSIATNLTASSRYLINLGNRYIILTFRYLIENSKQVMKLLGLCKHKNIRNCLIIC